MNIDLSKVAPDDTMSISARDRRFFTQLIRYMDMESEKAGPNPSKERFSVFRLAFEKIIEQSSLYRPLFRAIKQEYEQCINVLELGADEVTAMSADLHRLVLQPKTFLLRQKRCMELEDKLAVIEQENRQIQREIDTIREEMKEKEEEEEKKEEIPKIQIQETPKTNSIKPRTAHRRIPGMTLAEEMDLKLLDKYHDFIRIKCATFEQSLPTKYTSKEKRFEMQQTFEQKLIQLDKERENRLVLRNRLRLYHLALRTIQKYIDDEISSSSSSNTDQILLEDAILNALYKSLNLFATNDQNEDEDFDSSSMYDREAGALLNHIEIFMDLMDRGNYKDASYVAACSPKGVLRNMETLLRFKGVKKLENEEISPWLFHCRVLAETALEASAKPDKLISLECAKAASSENQLNMLYKWIVEERLTISYEMAEIAERAEAYDLAQFIYQRIGAHYQVAACLLKTNSSKRCLDYLMSISESISTTKDHLTKLFHEYPSVTFAVNIIKYSSNKYFQADELVLFFLQLDQHMNAMEFVEILLKDNEMNSEKEQIEKLKTCFDLLKKYSYLANHNESKLSSDGEKSDEHETEQELAHRLTRRITRSALDRFRRTRRCSTTSIPTLEPIVEHPSTPPSLSPQPSPSTQMPLCHKDFFNDFPGMLYFTEDAELKTDDTTQSTDQIDDHEST